MSSTVAGPALENLLYERKAGIAYVTLNRPKVLNARNHNEVVPATELLTRAEAILRQIFANAPLAVKFSLEAVNKGMETSQAEGMALEASLFGLCAGTEDKQEGTRAFLEKRAPQFQGR